MTWQKYTLNFKPQRKLQKMINHCLLFLFRWKYMREKPFLCRVYICKSAKQESRGGECCVLHLLFYILKKEKAKEEGLGGRGSYL